MDSWDTIRRLAEIGKIETHQNQINVTLADGPVSLSFTAKEPTLDKSLEVIQVAFGTAFRLLGRGLAVFETVPGVNGNGNQHGDNGPSDGLEKERIAFIERNFGEDD